MVNSQFFSGSTIDTLVSITSFNLLPPHSTGITAAEGEEVLHEALWGVHESVVVGWFTYVWAFLQPLDEPDSSWGTLEQACRI